MRSRSRVAVLLLAALPLLAGRVEPSGRLGPRFFYSINGEDQGSWPQILSAAGLFPGGGGDASIVVARSGEAEAAEKWRERLRQGAMLILEGDSGLAEAFGFHQSGRQVAVRSVVDERAPEMEIIWRNELELPVFETPNGAEIFARERWSEAPLVAGFREGAGAVLWVATNPGREGHERFPYLLNALEDLGLEPPFRSRRLWVFFDSSYRLRVDLAYFAKRWRAAGISALHVAAWHYFEPSEQRDAYLRRLIEECHRNAIQVYAWLELPHVSEQFWQDHPEWREQTAILQDAHLDWRKLMNLENPDCGRAVAKGVDALIDRFDWDGVNLAELYFESLEGVDNPARFTPMNDDVRGAVRGELGFDPVRLFDGEAHPEQLRAFLDYRAELARRLQERWIRQLEQARRRQPHLDIVLTHVDDRFDPSMRDKIGADTARVLPMLEDHDFTFLIEDPATVWDRGPERYSEIAEKYQPLTRRPEKLAIDINIVERYQDVYPTKQQTGTEMLRQLHLAGLAFPRVALYAEHSLLRPDLRLLSSAVAGVEQVEYSENRLVVTSRSGAGVPWTGSARLDGRLWPVGDGRTVWAPGGTHVVEPAVTEPAMRLLDLNGDLDTAVALPDGLEFVYRSSSRAFAMVDREPAAVEVDGAVAAIPVSECPGGYLLALPRGQHLVTLRLP